jgi:hypothetical protein
MPTLEENAAIKLNLLSSNVNIICVECGYAEAKLTTADGLAKPHSKQ